MLLLFLEAGSIHSQDFVQSHEFEPGTYDLAYAPSNNRSGSIFDARRNTVNIGMDLGVTPTLNYERLLPVGEQLGIGLRAGGGYSPLAHVGLGILQSTVVFFGPRNFLEFGFSYLHVFGPDPGFGGILAAYRYQAENGFMLKIYPMLLFEFKRIQSNTREMVWPGLAIGYAF
jgi:hypothetical protein